MIKISVVIITLNEEKNIERCIQSVLGIADEIVVLDSLSTDKTKEISLKYHARFIEQPFLGHIEQKNKALEFATYPHVLSLDADEALSDELRASILEIKSNWQSDGYCFNRLTSYCGKWIYHSGWYPDRKLRLFDIRKGKWGGVNPHDKYELQEGSTTSFLKGDLLHYTYDSIGDHIRTGVKYVEQGAKIAFEKRKKASIVGLCVKPTWRFFRDFVLKLGFLDGYRGLVICAAASFTNFLKYSILYNMYKQEKAYRTKFQYNDDIQVSLIITTYNKPDYLETVLKSVLKQTVFPKEVLIADDGSSEETSKLIELYVKLFPVPLIHCWQEDEGFRVAQIRNKAIAKASGNYIVAIDGDIVIHRKFIKDHIDRAREGQFIQGGRALVLEHKTNEVLRKKELPKRLFSNVSGRKNLIHSIFLSKLFSSHSTSNLKCSRSCNISFWKSDFIKINGFNEEFVGWGREDSELVVRFYNSGITRLKLVFMALGYHLHHAVNQNTELLQKNDDLLNDSIEKKVKTCNKGVTQYL